MVPEEFGVNHSHNVVTLVLTGDINAVSLHKLTPGEEGLIILDNLVTQDTVCKLNRSMVSMKY